MRRRERVRRCPIPSPFEKGGKRSPPTLPSPTSLPSPPSRVGRRKAGRKKKKDDVTRTRTKMGSVYITHLRHSSITLHAYKQLYYRGKTCRRRACWRAQYEGALDIASLKPGTGSGFREAVRLLLPCVIRHHFESSYPWRKAVEFCTIRDSWLQNSLPQTE